MTSRRAFLTLAGATLPIGAAQKFTGPLGLELYSLRREAEKDLPGTLARISKMGFRELETGALYGRTPAEFQRLLSASGLKVTSIVAEWKPLSSSTRAVAEQAHLLGAQYVCCSQFPHQKPPTLDDVKRAADHFNRWGRALSGAGLQFCYHPHGYEFGPGPDGTLFDTLVRQTDPKVANFEMDVFWIAFGKQDPVHLLEQYPRRFPLMHLKDLRKGEPKTGNPGEVPEEASVPLGTGEIDWPPVLRTAWRTGVRRYYIEEEHPNAARQILQTQRYLRDVRF
jgi:sugar phosphate isomerase/epimerase